MEDELKKIIDEIDDSGNSEKLNAQDRAGESSAGGQGGEMEIRDTESNRQIHTFNPPKIEEDDSLPLFIKIDRYESLLSIIDEIKHFSGNISEINVAINHIENLRRKAEELLAEAREELDKRIAEIDSMLIRPSTYQKKTYEAREIEDTLSELKKEISELRKNLGD